jgi:dephospho-CoA kinase
VLRVGLTGGIACGKSHVLRRLASHGFPTLDLDAVARDVTAAGSQALAEIAGAFGPGVVGTDGALDRPALAALVFADPAARSRLNAIVHPRVRAAEAAWARQFEGREGAVVVTDAALLVEAGAHLRFDRLVVVHCEERLQLARLQARDGLDERSARARLEAQMPLAEKRAFAHLEVDTSGSVEETDHAADALAAALAATDRGRPFAPAHGLATLLGGLVHGPEDGPRGLSPAVLLRDAVEAGGLEMGSLGRRLSPPAVGPWYRAAGEAGPGPAASLLAVALTAWALCRGRADPPFLGAAAGSVSRLTHADPVARADACLLALVAEEVAVAGGATAGVAADAARLAPLAARFGGAPPSPRLQAVWAAVRGHAGDPAGARAECESLGGAGSLAAALAGLGAPVEPSARAAALRSLLAALAPPAP